LSLIHQLFEEDFENKEEDDDSKLAVYDPWNREKIIDFSVMTVITTQKKSTIVTSCIAISSGRF
jgi:hypothetical protein